MSNHKNPGKHRSQGLHPENKLREGQAFRGECLALRPTSLDGVWELFFCDQRIAPIDLKNQMRLSR